jgi:hypothetical protein
LNVGTLATVYLKPVNQVFRTARPKRLADSPALQRHTLPTAIAEQAHRRALQPEQQQQQPVEQRTSEEGMGNLLGGDLAAAVDAADDYFSGGGGGSGTNPFAVSGGPVAGGGQYVVNQNAPQPIYSPQQGGDLLLL